MRNQIKQHLPRFIDCEFEVCEFDTLEELYQIPFVKRFMDDPDFDCFSLNNNFLVSIKDRGAYWWVVGYIKYPERMDIGRIPFDNESNRYIIPNTENV